MVISFDDKFESKQVVVELFSHLFANCLNKRHIMKFRAVKSALILITLFTSQNIKASLSSHPSVIKETVIIGGTEKIELHISNSISTALEYSFANKVDWIKIENSRGLVPGNSSISVSIELDASKLTEGKYSSSLLLNDPHHGTIPIPFELVVTRTTEIFGNIFLHFKDK